MINGSSNLLGNYTNHQDPSPSLCENLQLHLFPVVFILSAIEQVQPTNLHGWGSKEKTPQRPEYRNTHHLSAKKLTNFEEPKPSKYKSVPKWFYFSLNVNMDQESVHFQVGELNIWMFYYLDKSF